jgi:hypothetical protein
LVLFAARARVEGRLLMMLYWSSNLLLHNHLQ